MQIDDLYNKVAKTYNEDISGEVLNIAKQAALELAMEQKHPINSILALGMGDGTDVLPYTTYYPHAKLHGLDISEKMLVKAEKLLHCQTYHGDVQHASSIIEERDFDFILAHFITAYVPLTAILTESHKLIAKQGLISIVTNTMESFPKVHTLLAKLEQSKNPFNKLVAYHAKNTLKKVYVPQDQNHLQKMIEQHGFKVKAISEKKIAINLQTEKEIFDFFINGGWFVSGLVHPFLSHQLITRICKVLIHSNFAIPYEDDMHIAMVLAEPA